MGSKTKVECKEPSVALRMRSPTRLEVELHRYLVASEPDVEIDARDVIGGLAPFYDCAQRLGIDPVQLFETASGDLRQSTRELASVFARRSDISLYSFGWELEDTVNGPCYRRLEALWLVPRPTGDIGGH